VDRVQIRRADGTASAPGLLVGMLPGERPAAWCGAGHGFLWRRTMEGEGCAFVQTAGCRPESRAVFDLALPRERPRARASRRVNEARRGAIQRRLR